MKIAVIGGGAAGLTAAIFAKRTSLDSYVAVFEGNDRVGKKILSTGNGRCNLTNVNISPKNYTTRRPDFVETALDGRGFGFVRDFFASVGVPFAIEDGRAYPKSMRAGAVCDALRFECLRLGVELRVGSKVRRADSLRGRFLVEGELFDRLILACGGKAAPVFGTDGSGFEIAEALGHKVLAVYPALVQLRAADCDKSLRGIRAHARASAVVNGECVREEKGEIQFTDYGLSGIPIMQLSSIFCGKMDVVLDLLPDTGFSEAVAELSELAERCGDLPLPDFMGGYLHKNLTRRACALAAINPAEPASELTVRELKAFVSALKNMRFIITGTNSWENAQTTRGGVSLAEIDPKTMRSRLLGGLYFAGEIMDVCGDCGGYNLHWAWISGAAAGIAAAGGAEGQC